MYYISGKKNKESKLKYLEAKYRYNAAIRKAKRYEKRGWYHVIVMDSESANVICSL